MLFATEVPVPDAARKAITSDYALVCTAVLDPIEKNLTALFATLDPAFVNIDAKGMQINHDTFVKSIREQTRTLHGTDCSNSADSITALDDSTIEVVNEAKLSASIDAPDGRHDLEFSDKSDDMWKLEDGTWRETQSKDLSTIIKVDGNVAEEQGKT